MILRPSSQSRRALLQRATREYADQLSSDQATSDYLEGRGLLSSAEILGLGVVRSPLPGHDQYAGRLAIPYIGPRGNVYDIRYRCLEDHVCKDVGCPKYLGDAGVETRLYNTRSLVASTDYILIAEGELDAATLLACGWPAVGVPGASAWKKHRPKMFDGFSRVIVLGDGDEAGRKFVATVTKTLLSARGVIMCAGEDVNSTYVSGGREALVDLLREESE